MVVKDLSIRARSPALHCNHPYLPVYQLDNVFAQMLSEDAVREGREENREDRHDFP